MYLSLLRVFLDNHFGVFKKQKMTYAKGKNLSRVFGTSCIPGLERSYNFKFQQEFSFLNRKPLKKKKDRKEICIITQVSLFF